MRDLQVRRQSPFAYDSFFSDFDRMFDGLTTGLWAPVLRTEQNLAPSYEITEGDNGYLLSLDVPGIPKEEISVEVKDNQLRVTGERRKQDRGEESGRTFSQRRYGRFEKVFTLPAEIDSDKIEARHEDGVLHLMLPKAERAQAKTIKVESGAQGFFSKLIGRSVDKTANPEKSEKFQ